MEPDIVISVPQLDQDKAVVSLCIGGGQGIALCLQRLR